MKKKLEDYEHKKSGRGYVVYVTCNSCGVSWWEKWAVVKAGKGKYCTLDCSINDRHYSEPKNLGYETRKSRGRHIEVRIVCEYCGKDAWVKWGRIKEGYGKFCNQDCYNDFQRKEGESTWGKDKALFHFDANRNIWIAYWIEEKTGKRKTTTKARYLWEKYNGKVPNKYVVTYRDGNPENCELDNLIIISRSRRNSIALMGHEVSEETKKKISIKHTGKAVWTGFSEKSNYPGLSKGRKRRIRARDGHRCRICGKEDFQNVVGIVHHIDGNKKNQSWDNLILVCVDCHRKIHNRRKEKPEIMAFRSKLEY
jgi:5-methylcytosine-specific restriction endonuclease McrA